MDDQEAAWHAAVTGGLAKQTDFEAHWQTYRRCFAHRPAEAGPPRVWHPDPARFKASNVQALADHIGAPDYAALHAWSVQARPAFWSQVMERLRIPMTQMPEVILRGDVDDPDWLPGARLNIAAACFQGMAEDVAIITASEDDPTLRRITHGQLRSMANGISRGLLELGLSPGDGVALYMPMDVDCVAAYLGIVQAGLVVISIPDSFAPPEVATRLRLGGAKAIITVDSFRRAGKDVPMAPKAREAAGERHVIVVGDQKWRSFTDGGDFSPQECHPQDVSNVLFSSGTTGEPKAIPWTHLTPIKAAMDGHFHQDIHAGDVVAWPTNIGWMMGPWLIYAALMNRATLALWQGVPTSAGFLDFIRQAKVSMLGVVPAIVRAWRESGLARPGDLPDVKTFSSTGEASNVHDYLYLMSLADYRAPVIEYCGGTEIGGGHITGTVVQPASPATFTTPSLGLDFVILDDAGEPVAPGGHGQIFLVPPSIGLSQRLLNRDHHEEYYAGTPTGPRGEVLRRHGDEMHVLHGGFWAAGGRADDTMNLGGIKVSSIELEAVMNRHPAVSETAAVAVRPDGGGADKLVVFAVVKDHGSELRKELQGRIKAELNPLFRIHDLVEVEALPRTASNKVMRRELRAQYAVTA